MLEVPTLEVATALLTAACALTLIPHSRTSVGFAVELMVWIGFLLSSALCIATFGDPKLQETTAAIAWAGLRLVRLETASLLSIVGAWTAAHRFGIASWIELLAGVDVLALAFISSERSARKAMHRHLAGWYEVPNPAIRPAVPAADPLAAIDRRLAAATRTSLQTIKQTVATSPMLERAALGTAHVLRPGHLRLAMVKLALHMKWRRDQLAHAASPASVQLAARAPRGRGQPAAAGKSSPRRGHRDREVRAWTPAARPTSVIARSKKEGRRARVRELRHRVAS